MLKTIQSNVLEANKTPTFQNGWVDFGGSFQTAAYYKDPFGIVHLEGLNDIRGQMTLGDRPRLPPFDAKRLNQHPANIG